MNRVAELFGVYCDGTHSITDALSAQICPYTGKKCYKTRKSSPQTAIGTCTVWQQNENLIICPSRLLENNQIFLDCLHLLLLHEPGNEIYAVPEVSVPGGSVDYFLVSAKAGKVKDFAGIELQTLDTTGTVWPDRQRLLREYGFPADVQDLKNRRGFGINWKMTAKTILMQMHHKAETFESLGKHIVLVIQRPFLGYILRTFSFSHIQGVRIGDSVHIHSYDLEGYDNGLKLTLDSRISTDSSGIAKGLGLSVSPHLEIEELNAALEKKLCEQYRLKLFS